MLPPPLADARDDLTLIDPDVAVFAANAVATLLFVVAPNDDVVVVVVPFVLLLKVNAVILCVAIRYDASYYLFVVDRAMERNTRFYFTLSFL